MSYEAWGDGDDGDDGAADRFIEAGWLCAEEAQELRDKLAAAEALLNAPELHDFSRAVVLEAAHQRQRWPAEQDAGKAPPDWFWLVGYLAGKALQAAIAGNVEKALHHCISTAAALANWHANLTGQNTAVRPGIEPPVQDVDYHGSF